MHPHGCHRAYVGIEVRDCDRFQVVPAYNSNPKLRFSKKPYFKSNNLKRVLFQIKDVLDFKSLYLKKQTLPCFIKSFQKSKLCEINQCLGIKTAFKKMEF
jgi:hypothetical protein